MASKNVDNLHLASWNSQRRPLIADRSLKYLGGKMYFFYSRILIFYDGVEMSFDMDNPLPHFKGTKKGRAYLTTHRVCMYVYQ